MKSIRLLTILLFATATHAQAANREVVALTGHDLTLEQLVKIAENKADIAISPAGMDRINAAHAVIQHYVDNDIPAYGINTMYGQDVAVTVSPAKIIRFNRINVFQEATKVGDDSRSYLKATAVRAAWTCLVNSYSKGFSGASSALATEIVRRVNVNDIPLKVEDSGSMGDADLNKNNNLATHLYEKAGFDIGPGEATNLMTHNCISIARAGLALKRFEGALARAKVSLALGMEGYRANPSPIAESSAKAATLASKYKIQKEMRYLLTGSKLWEKDGPRHLQDFLSLRTSSDQLAAIETSVRRNKETITAYLNALQVSPMIDAKEKKIMSATEWDTTQLTLDLDHFRQALGMMALTVNARTLKIMSRPYSDLPSGFASDDATLQDGIYTRNVSYLATSLSREAVQNSQPVTNMSISFVAEGHEDYSSPFPNSVAMAETLVDRIEKIITIEAMVGSFAIMRRLESGELKKEDLPKPLRDVYQQIVKRSPLKLKIDESYTFAPLLDYFINSYEPPKQVSNISSAKAQ